MDRLTEDREVILLCQTKTDDINKRGGAGEQGMFSTSENFPVVDSLHSSMGFRKD